MAWPLSFYTLYYYVSLWSVTGSDSDEEFDGGIGIWSIAWSPQGGQLIAGGQGGRGLEGTAVSGVQGCRALPTNSAGCVVGVIDG